MKSRITALLLISALIFISSGVARADDLAPTRSETIASIHTQYDQRFDNQYSRLMVMKVKVMYDASMLSSFKAVLADFNGVRAFITTNLASETSDLEAVRSYAEEETGEFDNTIYLLEKQAATHKTITCVKGKTVKKVTALKPVCPKGYTKK